MHIRGLQRSDFSELVEIWEQFYKDEFEFPDFLKHYLCSYVVHDEQGIISVAGIRTITEIVAMTDKRRSVRDRMEALRIILHASKFMCEKNDYDQLHAFVQDEVWQRHLGKVGFRPTKGQAIVLDVKD